MYKIQEITEKKIWDWFIISSDFKFYTFLQSWSWGEIQIDLWKKINRLGIFDNDKNLIGVAWILKIRAKRWSYLLLPHWPLILWNHRDYFKVLPALISHLKELAKSEKYSFIRFNSPIENSLENKKSFEVLWCINAPMHENVEDTHLIDISISLEELFWNIKKGDRYYINRAKKEWVEVKIWNDAEHVNKLINMHVEHSKRSNWKNTYTPFSKKFIQSLYKNFWDSISTISTSYNWVTESILMTIKFWNRCVYYIAASDIQSPKFSPNYLCQWEAIRKAKEDWCIIYNLWWVSPDNNPLHPISWVSKFKRKFAWYDFSLLHAQDLPISKIYWANWIIETIRRKKRGYYYKKVWE